MKGDVEYMRGSNPSCSDTKVLGQYDGGHLHIFLRVFVSEARRQNWAYVEGPQRLSETDEFDEMAISVMRHLNMNVAGVEKILQAA